MPSTRLDPEDDASVKPCFGSRAVVRRSDDFFCSAAEQILRNKNLNLFILLLCLLILKWNFNLIIRGYLVPYDDPRRYHRQYKAAVEIPNIVSGPKSLFSLTIKI